MKLIAKSSLVLVLLASGLSNAAEVRSISREVATDFDGDKILTVYVKCAGVTEERSLERLGENAKWCAEDLPTMCARKKVKVARKVCGTHFERLVNEYRLAKAKEEASVDGD